MVAMSLMEKSPKPYKCHYTNVLTSHVQVFVQFISYVIQFWWGSMHSIRRLVTDTEVMHISKHICTCMYVYICNVKHT